MERFNGSLDSYQELAASTAVYPKEIGLVYTILGVTNEAGELAGVLKKMYRDSDSKLTEEVKEKMKKESGDVLWYLANVASELGFKLSEIAEANLIKLFDRKDRGVLKGSGDNR